MQPQFNLTPHFTENLQDYAPWVAQRGLREPYGYCQCGCGQKTTIAKWDDLRYGLIKDEPLAFINHHGRSSRIEIHFWKYLSVGEPNECWLWTGPLDGSGYGTIANHGVKWKAHRLSYTLRYGPIPDGLDILHKCDTRACCNWGHFFTGTQADNVKDMWAKGRGRHNTGRGEEAPHVKLKKAQVLEIRERFAQGERKAHLAKAFGVGKSHIQRIVDRINWTHI